MSPSDAMLVVLKDILLCLLGFRSIYVYGYIYVYAYTQLILVDIKYKTFQMCYQHQHACFFCLPVSPVWLSVSQTSMDDSQWKHRATLEFKSSGCVVSNNLNYDSSLSLSVSVKVIPKSFDTCLNSSQCYCFKPICQRVINEIASKQFVKG